MSIVLNVTEEQKKVIESQGYMVVEFKLWYQKLGKMLVEYAKKIIDTWRAIISFLQEQAIKVFKPLKDFAERILNESKPCLKKSEHLCCEKKKYPLVRSLGIAYETNISKRIIYHRCRDRC